MTHQSTLSFQIRSSRLETQFQSRRTLLGQMFKVPQLILVLLLKAMELHFPTLSSHSTQPLETSELVPRLQSIFLKPTRRM